MVPDGVPGFMTHAWPIATHSIRGLCGTTPRHGALAQTVSMKGAMGAILQVFSGALKKDHSAAVRRHAWALGPTRELTLHPVSHRLFQNFKSQL